MKKIKSLFYSCCMELYILRLNFKVKGVEVDGDDSRGYRFIVQEKKPIIIKLKNKDVILKKGRSRYTGYCDTTKEKLIGFMATTIEKNKKAIEIDVSYGVGLSEIVTIPKKYFRKIVEQLEAK